MRRPAAAAVAGDDAGRCRAAGGPESLGASVCGRPTQSGLGRRSDVLLDAGGVAVSRGDTGSVLAARGGLGDEPDPGCRGRLGCVAARHGAAAAGLLHHSDRGSIYACRRYQAALDQHAVIGSMSRRGDCWDNAVVESFFATLKRGLVHRQTWPTRSSLTRALVSYIDGWYNPERRHSSLGYVSPIAYEAQLTRAA